MSTMDMSTMDMPVQEPSVMGVPDRGFVGPQGRSAQFVVECTFSHALPDDPIVYPNEPGQSHLHVFFGNADTDADSTVESLAGAATTCDQPLDRASYWAPALLQNRRMVEPIKSTAYYRPGPDVDPTTIEPFPAGLMMIAGDAHATESQPTSVVAWTCGTGAERDSTPPSCGVDRTLRMLVTFPDCWDGEHVDLPGHRAHMHYSSGGACPASHPVPVPQLTFSVQYPVSGDPSDLELTSGGLLTGHADFFNSWDQAALTQEVQLCLHRNVVCGITSGRKTG
ncbi:MAG: DUF1996 domain-containing protein [Ilumatobacteraceae bacterium]